mmetsp:Transcript_114475/g.319894  ORF Transcript_114475/g.319894 Transcript_114475/m.319894 type:complete len:293 (+) Transcript_114475:99-977(+)
MMPKLATLAFAAATTTYSATGQGTPGPTTSQMYSTTGGGAGGGEPRFNVSEDCPEFLRDLLSQGEVSWMDMQLECEEDNAPAVHVIGKGSFTYVGQWPFACADPTNTTMHWSTFPSGLFQPCNTSSDCRFAGCSAVCTECVGEDCEHRRTCEPEPTYEAWAACVERMEMPVKRHVVERACQDPRDVCMALKHQYWDPLGCQIFEQEEGFRPDGHATSIAPMCAGYLDEYTLCLERYRHSDPVFFYHRTPGPNLRRNLDAAMLGPKRCVEISWEKAARIGAKPCYGAPGLAEA